jgi:hypothetical protein
LEFPKPKRSLSPRRHHAPTVSLRLSLGRARTVRRVPCGWFQLIARISNPATPRSMRGPFVQGSCGWIFNVCAMIISSRLGASRWRCGNRRCGAHARVARGSAPLARRGSAVRIYVLRIITRAVQVLDALLFLRISFLSRPLLLSGIPYRHVFHRAARATTRPREFASQGHTR